MVSSPKRGGQWKINQARFCFSMSKNSMMENFLSNTSLVNYIYYHVGDNLTRQFDEEYICLFSFH